MTPREFELPNSPDTPATVVQADARVGESPVWNDGNLLWVDLLAGRLHTSDVATGRDNVREIGGILGAVVLTDSPAVAAVTDDGYAVIGTDSLIPLASVTPEPHRRMNDGKCDAAGRFWAGSTTNDFQSGRGALHVWERDRGTRVMFDGLTLPNGLGWSPDSRTFYLVDSTERHILAFQFDVDDGHLGDPVLLCSFVPSQGLPDGLAVDLDGCLWVAFHGGGCVRRIAPDGRVLLEIQMPMSQPTSCAFGGGTELFVTSAREGLSEQALLAEGSAGSVVVVDVSIEGVTPGICLL